MDLRRNGLLSSSSGENGVIVQKTQSRFFVRSIFLAGGWREMCSFTRSIPFVLKQGDQQSQSDYLIVNVGKSKHPLPLVTVHFHKQTINASPYTFLQALFHRAVVLLDEEKILSPGKEITAVGVCCLKDGVLQIKSCKNLPCFLSEMSKDEIITHLSVQREGLMWISIVVGSISIVILGYAMYRVWNLWEGEQQEQGEEDEAREVEALVEQGEEDQVRNGYAMYRDWNIWEEQQQERGEEDEARVFHALVEQIEEDQVRIDPALSRVWNIWEGEQQEQGEQYEARELEALVEQGEEDQVREEELCVACLTRRREFAIVPCGHLVCCKSCITSIVSEMNPKCPICRQPVVRIAHLVIL